MSEFEGRDGHRMGRHVQLRDVGRNRNNKATLAHSSDYLTVCNVGNFRRFPSKRTTVRSRCELTSYVRDVPVTRQVL